MPFDNLEYISIDQQTTDFPKHFHETFCISLIHEGIEQIDFETRSLFSEKGSITITNPFEIHANPLMDTSSCLKFDTLYLSNDLMSHVLNGKDIRFNKRKINNRKTNDLFMELKNVLDTKNTKDIERCLERFLVNLSLFAEDHSSIHEEEDLNGFAHINSYIEAHIQNRFSLNELANMANINKYGFVKKFKASVGMTPMNYILMKKIFSSKHLIQTDSSLTDLAYQYNFTDLAHFSKTFKRYIGISPKEFKAKLWAISIFANILQVNWKQAF